MRQFRHPTRRTTLVLLAAAGAVGSAGLLRAQERSAIKVYKEPSCGCCGIWAKHLTAAGFAVSVNEVADVDSIKVKFGIPHELWTCHTADVAGYAIEGHVPAPVIRRLLAEMPTARGLAVPGMPAGSPGMESPSPQIYDVILFGPGGQRRYARCRGAQEI